MEKLSSKQLEEITKIILDGLDKLSLDTKLSEDGQPKDTNQHSQFWERKPKQEGPPKHCYYQDHVENCPNKSGPYFRAGCVGHSETGKPEFTKHIDAFMEELLGKLHEGHAEYGDKSFSEDPTQLLKELTDEALDITGWGFILWVRLRALRAELAKLTQTQEVKNGLEHYAFGAERQLNHNPKPR